MVIPCNGYSFNVQYEADQLNSHYLWITDTNGPFVDNGIQFELNVYNGVPSAYFGETIGLGSYAFAQDGKYLINIVGDDS
ncbi:hypothetical protein AYI68_g4431, partial [Smittium mucronatum]